MAKIAVLGGDMRQKSVAERLNYHGYEAIEWGTGALCALDYKTVIEAADVVVLPMPVSGDGCFLFCPLADRAATPPKISEILELSSEKQVFGGRFSPAVKKYADDIGVNCTDYFEGEDFQIFNSSLTAEGAIFLAMSELKRSIFGAKCAVIGYGKIGKTLAPKLQALGAEVTVSARKISDIAFASAFGYNVIKTSEVENLDKDVDVIFNTVPYWVFDEKVLSNLGKNTFIIDLSSAPGGVDVAAAKKLGVQVITAPGLPGKYAPGSAGTIIADGIVSILKKQKGRP